LNRRELLIASCSLAPALLTAVAAGAQAIPQSANPLTAQPSRPRKVIVAGGHPGDPEYGCGGTIVRLTALGHQVVLLYLNDGAWPPTSASVRVSEATRACEILKARPAYAGQANGHAIVDEAHYKAYQKILAAEKPDAVFTQWPIDNHRDHRAITNLTYDAWKESGRAFALYYYEVSDGEDTLQFSPNQFVDITATEPLKRAACYAHASQTPDRYYELQDSVAKFRGLQSGYIRAEAFLRQQQSPFDLFAEVRIETR